MINKLAIVDLETTGLNPAKDEIIEIGAVLVSWPELEEKDVDSFETRVKPSPLVTVTPEAAKVNGYNLIDWDYAPRLSDIWGAFKFYLGGKNTAILAQNVTFDWGFLMEAEWVLGTLDVDYHRLDLCSMALIMRPELQSLSMVNLAPYFGIDPEPLPHRAINGARTALQILRKLRFGGPIG